MSPIDRIEKIAASQRRIDNYLTDLAKAVGSTMGELGAMDRAKLEGRLGPMGHTMDLLLGRGESGMIGSPVANTLGNTTPAPGQGNQFQEPALDTVKTVALSTSEQGISFDLYGKYVLNSGAAPTQTIELVQTGGGGSTMASSICALAITGATAAGNVSASVYTQSAVTISANSPALPYIVASCRLLRFGSPNNATNVTTWTATLDLLKNGSTVVGTQAIDLLSLSATESIALVAFAAGPFTATDTYDLRVTVAFVTTGSASTTLRLGIGEVGVEFAYTPDATPFTVDRTPGLAWRGDGSDGNVTIASGTTTLTRDMLYENLTIAAGATLKPAGFVVYARNRIVNRGTISRDGANASGVTAGAALAGGSLAAGTAGGDGGPGAFGAEPGYPGGAAAPSVRGAGGKGAKGCEQKAGGTAGAATYAATEGTYLSPATAMRGRTGIGTALMGGGGGGGGSGLWSTAGYGGGGGGGGGLIVLVARYMDLAGGTVSVHGGDGAANAGGGGGGGGGGAIICVYDVLIRGTDNVAGGAIGSGGTTPADAGSDGAAIYIRG